LTRAKDLSKKIIEKKGTLCSKLERKKGVSEPEEEGERGPLSFF